MRGGLDHAPCVAGRAYATPFAGEGDQEVVSALVTVCFGKAVRKNSAFEIATKGTFHMGRRRFIVFPA
jgi:hypothetical protein